MTGYGWGESSQDGYKITVELNSVNRKQGEVSIVLPREFELLESQLRDLINKRIARGRLTARVALHAGEQAVAQVKVNQALAEAYAAEFARLAKKLQLTGPIPFEVILRTPGVLVTEEPVTQAEHFWPALQQAATQALDALVRMREREGEHLAKDLRARISALRKAVNRVSKQAPKVQERYRQQLVERVRNAGLPNVVIDDERVLKELVLFADRSDISEELSRLESHFQQFDDCTQSDEPIGRTLDFLAQEMNREINTVGSKANDGLISRQVVILKTELEKFREQAQNVE
jgi:uncharacterized protein (TIGR00255 family)